MPALRPDKSASTADIPFDRPLPERAHESGPLHTLFDPVSLNKALSNINSSHSKNDLTEPRSYSAQVLQSLSRSLPLRREQYDSAGLRGSSVSQEMPLPPSVRSDSFPFPQTP